MSIKKIFKKVRAVLLAGLLAVGALMQPAEALTVDTLLVNSNMVGNTIMLTNSTSSIRLGSTTVTNFNQIAGNPYALITTNINSQIVLGPIVLSNSFTLGGQTITNFSQVTSGLGLDVTNRLIIIENSTNLWNGFTNKLDAITFYTLGLSNTNRLLAVESHTNVWNSYSNSVTITVFDAFGLSTTNRILALEGQTNFWNGFTNRFLAIENSTNLWNGFTNKLDAITFNAFGLSITNRLIYLETNSSVYVTASITNGLSNTNYVNFITNGLASINYVNGITNGLVHPNTLTNNWNGSIIASALLGGTTNEYGAITANGGAAFTGTPPYGIASIGRILNSNSGWDGSGFLFANSSMGTSAFSMVYNVDIAWFGLLNPNDTSTILGEWNAQSLTLYNDLNVLSITLNGVGLTNWSTFEVSGAASIVSNAYSNVWHTIQLTSNAIPLNALTNNYVSTIFLNSNLTVASKLGIGKTNPITILDIYGTVPMISIDANSDTGYGAGIYFQRKGATKWYQQVDSLNQGVNRLDFDNISGLPVLSLLQNGSVLIASNLTSDTITVNSGITIFGNITSTNLTAYVNSITNGLSNTNYVNSITNGLSNTNYVNNITNNFVASTNGYATNLNLVGVIVVNPTDSTETNIGMQSSDLLVTSQSNSAWLGYGTLYNSTGIYNTAMGSYAGSGSKGSYNTSLGYLSGSNSAGNHNISIGQLAGVGSPGSYNSYLGYGAGNYSAGSFNVAIGTTPAYNSAGCSNVSLGYDAGNASPGSNNTSIGTMALMTATGKFNTALGYFAGYQAGGVSNVFIGAYAGSQPSFILYTNVIAIGASSVATSSYTAWLGNANINNTWLYGNVNTPSNMNLSGGILNMGSGSITGITSLIFNDNTKLRDGGYFTNANFYGTTTGAVYFATTSDTATNLLGFNAFGLSTTNRLVYLETNSSGYVTASITNGLSNTNYVNSITNGLANTNYVNSITNSFVINTDGVATNLTVSNLVVNGTAILPSPMIIDTLDVNNATFTGSIIVSGNANFNGIFTATNSVVGGTTTGAWYFATTSDTATNLLGFNAFGLSTTNRFVPLENNTNRWNASTNNYILQANGTATNLTVSNLTVNGTATLPSPMIVANLTVSNATFTGSITVASNITAASVTLGGVTNTVWPQPYYYMVGQNTGVILASNAISAIGHTYVPAGATNIYNFYGTVNMATNISLSALSNIVFCVDSDSLGGGQSQERQFPLSSNDFSFASGGANYFNFNRAVTNTVKFAGTYNNQYTSQVGTYIRNLGWAGSTVGYIWAQWSFAIGY